ncbi:MAG: peptidoglycan DD-metalloendopeptidase family protein [Holosporales bacterium]|jgi:septal ring factor EnvC (AmiA/AmiB activator)|nr:peptidoglycan DD-metalloendopeptidase family protein [Holosporales bacterium]
MTQAENTFSAQDHPTLENILASLQTEKEKLQASLHICQRTISRILTGLVTFSQHTPVTLALSSPHPERPVQQAILLRHLVPTLEKKARELQQQQKRLQETQHIGKQVADILDGKSLSLLKKRQELESILNQHVTSLPTALKRVLENKIEYLAEQARSMDELVIELDAEISKVLKKEVQKQKKEFSFQLPVEGKIHATFGKPIPNTKEPCKGILVKTPPGARVVASAPGRVVFAGPFKRYGKIVILDHGSKFHSLVAGLAAVKVDLGDEIPQGGYLGHMAQKTSSFLIFELRKDGNPIDPKSILLKR